jgi:predicted nucleic acid-binding protein
VRQFLDTSVLVATFYGDHEHHEPSLALFLQQKKQTGYAAAHSLAETYSVLTGMPGKHRATPDEALLFLGDVRERLTLITIDQEEYFGALESAAASGISGGAIYDALLARCAVKGKAEVIYTWNVKHYTRPGMEFALRVKTPENH